MERPELAIVDGATKLYGIIGDPIEQVKSPEVITKIFRDAGYNGLMLPLHARPDDFDAAIRGLKALVNFRGIVLTVPHKVRAMPHVDHLLPRAVRVGAVNVMRREQDGTWTGDMFDGQGLVRAIRDAGFDPSDKRVMLIGAGGAGSAIADALAEAEVRSVTIADLNDMQAKEVVSRLGKAHPHCMIRVGPASAENCDLLVNATPTGMTPGDGMPGNFGAFDSRMFVADVVTKPEITPLLAHAMACGCKIASGVAMFHGQAKELTRFLVPDIKPR